MEMDEAVGHYRLLERIGAGGLGEVYRARDTKVGRTVALKLLPPGAPGDETRQESFRAAVREASALSHPNIATLFDAGGSGGRTYLAYEFVSGISLRQEIGGRAVNPRRAVELAIQIADALAEGHSREVMHGDLRPETIMVTAKGSAKVLDFGLAAWTRGGAARAAAAASPDHLSLEALSVAGYLSPEQALGSSIDARSDLFSLGAILYEMLTGRPAFTGTGSSSPVLNVIRVSPPPPSQINTSLSRELDEIVARALAKDLAARIQSAAAFGAELRSVAAVLDVRAGDAAPSELMPLEEEPRTWFGLILLAVVAVAALAWYYWRTS